MFTHRPSDHATCTLCNGRLILMYANFPADAPTIEAAIAGVFHMSHGQGLTLDQLKAKSEAPRVIASVILTPEIEKKRADILAKREEISWEAAAASEAEAIRRQRRARIARNSAEITA